MKFHHVGHITSSLSRSEKIFKRLGFEPKREPIVDPGLEVSLLFLTNNGVRLELVEPFVGKENLWKTLRARPGLYHIAFEVIGTAEYLRSWSNDQGFFATIEEQNAVAFPGSTVSFFWLRVVRLLRSFEKPANQLS